MRLRKFKELFFVIYKFIIFIKSITNHNKLKMLNFYVIIESYEVFFDIIRKDGMVMAENIVDFPSCEMDTFLIYPDFQKTFEGHMGLYGVILDYKNQFERLYETMDRSYWESQKMVDFAKNRFVALSEAAKTEGQRDKYLRLYENWTAEDNLHLAQNLYRANLEILERYAYSYDDIRSREDTKAKTASLISKFFNSLADPIAKEVNLEFDFESRFKSWHSTVEKMLTKTESLDLSELQEFNDIYACRFVVSSGVGNDSDYPGAESECFMMMNIVIRHILKLGGSLLRIKDVGETSDQIWSEYRNNVKDYISNPKPNGYKALHCCFEIPIKNRKIRFEVQVLSCWMMHNNEVFAPHLLHKENTKVQLKFDPTLVQLRKFYAGYREDGSLVVTDRGEGLLEPKKISTHKWYHKH